MTERLQLQGSDSRWDYLEARVGGEELHRLRDNRVGADRHNPGKYAVYFYDEDETEIRSVGGFASASAAAEACWPILAESVLEAVGLAQADQETP